MDKNNATRLFVLVLLITLVVIVMFITREPSRIAVILSIYALIISIFNGLILPVVFSPKIKLEAVNDDECIQSSPFYSNEPIEQSGGSVDASPGKRRIDSNWLSLRIRNVGKATATGVYCKLVEMRNQAGELVRPINPAPLNWTVYQPYPKGDSKIQLAAGEYHLVNLVVQEENWAHFKPAVVVGGIPNSLWEQRNAKFGAGKYTLKVTIYGDNIEPMPYPVEILVGKNYKDLKFLKEIK